MTDSAQQLEDPVKHRVSQQPAEAPVLTREILTLSAVVVLGAIMTVLDATIVNVALPALGREFGTSIATIQWVTTAYLLAFAGVIPLTGWASQRLGTKQLWLLSLALFTIGSLLAGLSWSIAALIAFRVVQGLGGGMIMPLGQTILAQAAGPNRMGRVMSIIGVPLLLAPIIGPVIGGALVGAVSWRWIFFVNLPVSAVAFLLAIKLLPRVPRGGGQKLDVLGAILLPSGIALFLWGLAEAGQKGTPTAAAPITALLVGLALVAGFVLHALRSSNPLLDVRLFARRGFASAAATNLMVGVALFGVALLLPLYLQILRGLSPLETGLVLIPQGLGAAIAISIAGILTDKLGAGRVVPVGILLALAGTLAYTRISVDSSYWYLAGALFLIGAGLGATITPSMAAAFQDLSHAEIPGATSAINVVQRVAASLGTALLAVVLQRTIAVNVSGFHGDIGQATALARYDPQHTAPAIADAFGTTFWVAFALTALAFVPALLLPAKAKGSPNANHETKGRTVMTDDARPPLLRRLQMRVMPVVFRVVNVPMRLVLGLPISTPLGKRLMLAYLTGRKTGRHYRQPISYIRDDETLLTPGGGRWKLNLVQGQPAHVRLRGRDISLGAELVRDPVEVDRLLGIMSAKNPMVGRFVPIPKRDDGHYDRDRLDLAIRHGFCIVRWSPVGSAAREAIMR
jgi:EmrB/QacA subfamily drug resistance transporter